MFGNTTIPRRAAAPAGIAALRGAIEAMLQRWAAAEDRRRNADGMRKLPDHLLRDIGVTRDEIRRELRRARRM